MHLQSKFKLHELNLGQLILLRFFPYLVTVVTEHAIELLNNHNSNNSGNDTPVEIQSDNDPIIVDELTDEDIDMLLDEDDDSPMESLTKSDWDHFDSFKPYAEEDEEEEQ